MPHETEIQKKPAKGFLKSIMDKIDKYLQEKAKNKSSCCATDKKDSSGSSCCK